MNDSATRWIIEKSDGLTKTGLVLISESLRAYPIFNFEQSSFGKIKHFGKFC